MSRTFTYRFEDGTVIDSNFMSSIDLDVLRIKHGRCIYNEWAEFMGVGEPSRLGVIGGANSRGDAFKTGWNPALGMEIKSPEHYKRTLKEKGLREVGNEKQVTAPVKRKGYIDDQVIKEAIDAGAKISGNEAEALKSGNGLT